MRASSSPAAPRRSSRGRFADMPEVDRVIGNAEKMRAETLPRPRASRTARACGSTTSCRCGRPRTPLIDGFGSRARAYVQVQNGCDHRCTFCIIPYGRGPSRSVPAGEVVAQMRRLVEAGYRRGRADRRRHHRLRRRPAGRHEPGPARAPHPAPRARAASACAFPPSTRSRPTRTSCDAIAEEPRLMPHLHLSLQSGDDMILKRMKRRHVARRRGALLRGGAAAAARHRRSAPT